MTHETHYCCNKRLKEEGGKARCCYCHPHKDCTDSQFSPEHILINPMTNKTTKLIEEVIIGDGYGLIPYRSEEDFRKALKALVQSAREEERRATILEVLNVMSTHAEDDGGYCDTCRSKCVNMAYRRIQKLLSNPES